MKDMVTSNKATALSNRENHVIGGDKSDDSESSRHQVPPEEKASPPLLPRSAPVSPLVRIKVLLKAKLALDRAEKTLL